MKISSVRQTRWRASLLIGWFVCFACNVTAQNIWTVARPTEVATDLNCVYFADAKRGWAAGDEGAILATTDGGVAWTRQTIALRDAINDIYFRNKDDGMLLAGTQVWKTTDGGRTWREGVKFSESSYNALPELYSVQFVTKTKGWIVGSLSRGDNVVDALLLLTTDGGETWTRQSVPTRSELIDIDFDGDKRGWIVGAAGTILTTDDGGATWRMQKSNTNVALYNVDFRGRGRGWAVGEGGMILRTANGGEVWEAVRAPVRSTLLSVKFTSDTSGFIVGRNGVILHSTDGGASWTRETTGTRENFYSLFVRGSRGWAVGSKGLVAQYER